MSLAHQPHQDHTGEEHGQTIDDQAAPYVRTAAAVLDAAAVRNQVFTVVRLREGYDLAEVDAFLAQVETSLGVLLRENAELRTRSRSPGDAQSRADSARIVALAQETAGRAIASAHKEAERIVQQARDRAEAVMNEALDQVAREREALSLSRQDLESRLDSLNRSVGDYRDRVADTLQAQMTQLSSLLADLTEMDADWQQPLAGTAPPAASDPDTQPFDPPGDGVQPGSRS
ncbi:DivIVA domain-containing protein [Nonomuraea sp. M3C6]|uniref:Cell wall synthesis protein Wag31 n=1 Tax=Nonomuraea marmarensis TaxID=3351344 RepID=A0ABW7AAE7_9ACTN